MSQKISSVQSLPTNEELCRILASALDLPAEHPNITDLSLSLSTPLGDAWRESIAEKRAGRLLDMLDIKQINVQQRLALLATLSMALLENDIWSKKEDLNNAVGLIANAKPLSMQLSGLPVLHQGLARSVKKNQLRSLVIAVFVVIMILTVMFGSFKDGVLVAMPTLFTLVAIHGTMGIVGIHLDVGTSLLGSLILANGVDYAVHLAAGWQTPTGGSLARAAGYAAHRAGPAIWTSAGTLFVGFLVLSLGEARVLQNVTSLKAAAMLVGALSTFLIVPVLARRNSYPILHAESPSVEPSEVVETVLAEGKK